MHDKRRQEKRDIRVGGVREEGEEESESEKEEGSEEVRMMVMWRVTGRPPAPPLISPEDEENAENESYLRSLPRPESGAGPASVSSQSL